MEFGSSKESSADLVGEVASFGSVATWLLLSG
jgi:hypothetical protein